MFNPFRCRFNRVFAGTLMFSASAFAETVWFSSLELPSVWQEWANGVPTANKSSAGKPISIANQIFERGVGMHAPYTLFVDLNKGGQRFSAQVGVDDGAAIKAISSKNPLFGGGAFNSENTDKAKNHVVVSFQIYGDGKILFDSGKMKLGDPAKAIDVDLCGIRVLEMVASNHGYYPWALLSWGEAKFEMASGIKPKILAERDVDADRVILTPPKSAKPRINGAKVVGVGPGKPFLHGLAVTGKRPMQYSIENLPSGLTFDRHTGRISGVLKTPGDYQLLVKAWNAEGSAESVLQIRCGETLALTPPMGWNSWQIYGTKVSQEKVLRQAHAMVKSGLIDHGYNYINIDNGWTATRGGKFNAIQPDLVKFPDIKGCVDAIHGLGLRAGIYSSPWISGYGNTCGDTSDHPDGRWDPEYGKTIQGRCGKYSFAANDVQQWVEWEFDLMKYDWHPMDIKHTRIMSEALKAASRDFVFTISNTGFVKDAPEYVKLTNFWRIGGDNLDIWPKIDQVFDIAEIWAPFAGPGHWNDPDMLLLGVLAWGNEKQSRLARLSANEEYSHMSFWSLGAYPLLLSCDLEKLDPFTLGLLTNDEVLEVNQDSLGKAARRLLKENFLEIWVKEMADGSKVVGIFNRGRIPLTRSIRWQELQLNGQQKVRDLWRQQDMGIFASDFAAEIPRHGVQLIRLWPTN